MLSSVPFRPGKPTFVIAHTHKGHPITFMQFFRYGLGVVIASLLISTVYLWLRYLA